MVLLSDVLLVNEMILDREELVGPNEESAEIYN